MADDVEVTVTVRGPAEQVGRVVEKVVGAAKPEEGGHYADDDVSLEQATEVLAGLADKLTDAVADKPVEEWPPAEIGGVPLLHKTVCPARSKPWGCLGCKLFQYSPSFTKADREQYAATLDPNRREKKNSSYQMEGNGPAHARVMVVLDEPSNDEDKFGLTAGGAGARFLRKLIHEAGGDPNQFYWTYAVKCRSPDDGLDMRGAAYCSKFLSQEINRVQPDIIVAVGSLPTKLCIGKSDASVMQYHGVATKVTIAGREAVVYPLWSTGYVFRNDYLGPKYAEAVAEMVAFTKGERHLREDGSLYEMVETVDDAIVLCQQIKALVDAKPTTKVEADLETSGLNPYEIGARISVVSLCVNKNKGYAIPFNHNDVPWTAEGRKRFVAEGLRPLMQHRQVRLRWHNGKFDYKWFPVHMGFWPRDIFEDTMLTHYASDENIEHGLKPLALRYTDMGDYDAVLDRYLSANFPSDAPRYDLVPWSIIGKYAAMDTVAARKLGAAVKQHIVEQNDPAVEVLAYRVLPAYSSALTRLEAAGCYIDMEFALGAVPVFEENEDKSYKAILAEPVVRKFQRDMEQFEREKIAATWKDPKPGSKRKKKTLADLPSVDEKRYFEFSLNSTPQMQKLLYDPRYYAHPVLGYSDSGQPATDKEAMNALLALGSPIAKRIVEYRLDSKLKASYLLPIINTCQKQAEPYLHPNLLAHGTKTGRLSCKDPNLQATPNKGAGYIKRLIVSRYGSEGCILQADYSQIELRILACISGDRGMIDAFCAGADLHELTVCLLMDMTMEQYKALKKSSPKEAKILRTIAKRINFGIPYGVAGPGISGMLKGEGIDRDEDTCNAYIDKFFREKPKVKQWIDLVQDSTALDAISKSLFGRNRRLEQVRSSIESTVSRAKRQAINHPIQSTAGDMTLTSLTLMDQEICLRSGKWDPDLIYPTIDRREFPVTEGWDKAHIVLTVHDSIVFDCHRSVAPAVAEMCSRVMPNVASLAHHIWGEQITEDLSCLSRVPMAADLEIGPTYRDAVGFKDGKDIDKAMFIGDRKKTYFDATPRGEWTEDMDKAAKSEYDTAHAA